MTIRSVVSVFAVAAIIGLLIYGLLGTGSDRLAPGDVAPAITLPNLDGGEEVSLASHHGEWVLVNFWASWCPPCQTEAPELEEFQERYGSDGVTVLGIDSRDLGEDGAEFVDRYRLTYLQLHDGQGITADKYGTGGFPETFLIEPKGRVRLMWKGPVTFEQLKDEVEPLLLPRRISPMRRT